MVSTSGNGEQWKVKLELPAAPLVFGEIEQSPTQFFQVTSSRHRKNSSGFLVPFEGKNVVGQAKKDLEPHTRLVVNAIAQAEALITGKQVHKEKYRNMTGNRPSTFLGIEATQSL